MLDNVQGSYGSLERRHRIFQIRRKVLIAESSHGGLRYESAGYVGRYLIYLESYPVPLFGVRQFEIYT